MTYYEVAQMIAEIGIPFAYYQYPVNEAPPLPYLVYFYPNREDFNADNENYAKVETLVIELYTETKDFYREELVETVLASHHITYDKTESFINKEQMYQCYYESEVLINGYQ